VTDPRPDLVVWDQPGRVSRRVLAPVDAVIQRDDVADRRAAAHVLASPR